ncbi:bromodomain protein, putative [Babesia caballi]|uniref:Bromodomain protein, putative n=1 Tax=Babesia caballi TaxID=5871 RepID=A0AAV4M0Y8_BABCB|nr:bromodomain protein, putative [Babesia caballi]
MEAESEMGAAGAALAPEAAAADGETAVVSVAASPVSDFSAATSYRGDLLLEQEEVDRLNELISQANFRFVLYVHEPAPAKPHKKPKSDPVLRSLSSGEGALSSFEPRSRKSFASLKSRSNLDDDSQTFSPSESVEKRALRKRRQRVRYYEEFAEDSADGNYRELRPERSQRSQKDSMKRQASGSYEKRPLQLYRAVPVLSRSLPKLPKDCWEYTAYRMLQSIKYMDNDKWFWYPVDPVADGVPNYPKVVHTPMDFHTITERLHLRQYSHPFAFQCDFRQIFFNAFLFYPPDNRIWQAAEHLGRVFEEKLRATRYLHPEEFYELLTKGEDGMRAALLEYNEATYNRKGKWASNSLGGLDEVDLSQPLEKRKAAQQNRHKHVIDDFMYNEGEEDDDDSFNELSSAASADEFSIPVESGRGRPRGLKKRGGHLRGGYYQRRGRVGDMSDDSDSGSRMRYLGDFVVPEVGEVPPPPPPAAPALQKTGILERNLTPAQTRTLDINLSRLAPNQRRAALELVEDDLGILAEAFMNDRSFTFDPSLLSVDKQRRVFVYINQMVKRNIEAVQATYERGRHPKPPKDGAAREAKDSALSNPSEMFDASSSSSSISDVASNFLSSDDFFDSSDDERASVGGEAAPRAADGAPLPEYTPVDELRAERVQLTRGIMGDHADFLTHVEAPAVAEEGGAGQQGKKSAWMEWKGQAIHHGTVAQQNGVKPRSVDEKIAESLKVERRRSTGAWRCASRTRPRPRPPSLRALDAEEGEPTVVGGGLDLGLELADGAGRVEALGAGAGAVEDAVAAVELHRVVHVDHALDRVLVAAVGDPARADAHLRRLALQPRLHRLVLLVKVGHVGDQVTQHEEAGQRLDLDGPAGLGAGVDGAEAGEAVLAVDVHGAAAAYALAAAAAEEHGVQHSWGSREHVDNQGAPGPFQQGGDLGEPGGAQELGVRGHERALAQQVHRRGAVLGVVEDVVDVEHEAGGVEGGGGGVGRVVEGVAGHVQQTGVDGGRGREAAALEASHGVGAVAEVGAREVGHRVVHIHRVDDAGGARAPEKPGQGAGAAAEHGNEAVAGREEAGGEQDGGEVLAGRAVVQEPLLAGLVDVVADLGLHGLGAGGEDHLTRQHVAAEGGVPVGVAQNLVDDDVAGVDGGGDAAGGADGAGLACLQDGDPPGALQRQLEEDLPHVVLDVGHQHVVAEAGVEGVHEGLAGISGRGGAGGGNAGGGAGDAVVDGGGEADLAAQVLRVDVEGHTAAGTVVPDVGAEEQGAFDCAYALGEGAQLELLHGQVGDLGHEALLARRRRARGWAGRALVDGEEKLDHVRLRGVRAIEGVDVHVDFLEQEVAHQLGHHVVLGQGEDQENVVLVHEGERGADVTARTLSGEGGRLPLADGDVGVQKGLVDDHLGAAGELAAEAAPQLLHCRAEVEVVDGAVPELEELEGQRRVAAAHVDHDAVGWVVGGAVEGDLAGQAAVEAGEEVFQAAVPVEVLELGSASRKKEASLGNTSIFDTGWGLGGGAAAEVALEDLDAVDGGAQAVADDAAEHGQVFGLHQGDAEAGVAGSADAAASVQVGSHVWAGVNGVKGRLPCGRS